MGPEQLADGSPGIGAAGSNGIAAAHPGRMEAPDSKGNAIWHCAVGLVALANGIVMRYRYHRETIETCRSRGITDLNKDGTINGFADDFIDDF